jgi:uncharacterized protein (TIGR03435 family)
MRTKFASTTLHGAKLAGCTAIRSVSHFLCGDNLDRGNHLLRAASAGGKIAGMKRVFFAALLGAGCVFGQIPQAGPSSPYSFEAVTIKPDAASRGWALQPTPDGYIGHYISLYKLVQEAYGVFVSKLVIGGPEWIDKDKFDLEAKYDPAKVPGNLTYRQKADMLRAVLADRFNLKVHFETRDFPVYDLVLAKGGPKLTVTPADKVNLVDGHPVCSRVHGSHSCTMGDLARQLSLLADRPVIDKTGLTARYEYDLHATSANASTAPTDAAPLVFTAVQEQLGLKLEPSVSPLDVLVIDSADHPTEN